MDSIRSVSLPSHRFFAAACRLARLREDDPELRRELLVDDHADLGQRPSRRTDEQKPLRVADGRELLPAPVRSREAAVRRVHPHLYAADLLLLERQLKDLRLLPPGRLGLLLVRGIPEPAHRVDELGEFGRHGQRALVGLVGRSRGENQPLVLLVAGERTRPLEVGTTHRVGDVAGRGHLQAEGVGPLDDQTVGQDRLVALESERHGREPRGLVSDLPLLAKGLDAGEDGLDRVFGRHFYTSTSPCLASTEIGLTRMGHFVGSKSISLIALIQADQCQSGYPYDTCFPTYVRMLAYRMFASTKTLAQKS